MLLQRSLRTSLDYSKFTFLSTIYIYSEPLVFNMNLKFRHSPVAGGWLVQKKINLGGERSNTAAMVGSQSAGGGETNE